MNKKYIGWFGKDGLENDPGLDINCMVSGKPLVKGKIKTISLMGKDSNKSYFFRVLAEEWDKLSPYKKSLYESSIIDNDFIL